MIGIIGIIGMIGMIVAYRGETRDSRAYPTFGIWEGRGRGRIRRGRMAGWQDGTDETGSKGERRKAKGEG